VTRKVTPPGPRCATCHREEKKRRKRATWEAYILKTYGITGAQYDLLYSRQGGVCFICRRATGKTKKLAVDHDHATGFVRGLLCSPCNQILGHLRDDWRALDRASVYLRQPFAYDHIGRVKPSE
jgi:hypothetical protein